MPKKANLKEVKIRKKEFVGNVLVTVSKQEVRLWVCDDKGQNIFRFKATGQVYDGEYGIIIVPKEPDA